MQFQMIYPISDEWIWICYIRYIPLGALYNPLLRCKFSTISPSISATICCTVIHFTFWRNGTSWYFSLARFKVMYLFTNSWEDFIQIWQIALAIHCVCFSTLKLHMPARLYINKKLKLLYVFLLIWRNVKNHLLKTRLLCSYCNSFVMLNPTIELYYYYFIFIFNLILFYLFIYFFELTRNFKFEHLLSAIGTHVGGVMFLFFVQH